MRLGSRQTNKIRMEDLTILKSRCVQANVLHFAHQWAKHIHACETLLIKWTVRLAFLLPASNAITSHHIVILVQSHLLASLCSCLYCCKATFTGVAILLTNG